MADIEKRLARALEAAGADPAGCQFEPTGYDGPDHHGPEFASAILATPDMQAIVRVVEAASEVQMQRDAERDLADELAEALRNAHAIAHPDDRCALCAAYRRWAEHKEARGE